MFLPLVMTIYLRHFWVQVFGMVNVYLPAMATTKNVQCGRPDKSRGTFVPKLGQAGDWITVSHVFWYHPLFVVKYRLSPHDNCSRLSCRCVNIQWAWLQTHFNIKQLCIIKKTVLCRLAPALCVTVNVRWPCLLILCTVTRYWCCIFIHVPPYCPSLLLFTTLDGNPWKTITQYSSVPSDCDFVGAGTLAIKHRTSHLIWWCCYICLPCEVLDGESVFWGVFLSYFVKWLHDFALDCGWSC